MLQSDIGIDLGGIMYILFKKGSEIPADSTMVVVPTSNEETLSFYQGQCVYVKDNLFLGSRVLTHSAKMGRFNLKCVLLEGSLQVFIDELIGEYSYINEEVGHINEEENLVRDTLIARNNFSEYIRETLITLETIRDKVGPELIEKVRWASGILNVEDVTKEEFELSQNEVEGWINPVLSNIN
jgi:hypothetical protein